MGETNDFVPPLSILVHYDWLTVLVRPFTPSAAKAP
jgi:hypothetical protein